jgi:hypothetical protein
MTPSFGGFLFREFQVAVENMKPIRLTVFFAMVLSIGCGHSQLPRRAVFGKVTCGGEPVFTGKLRFVPVENTIGPVTSARISDGQYRADNRGGVPIGKHRVEISARRTTGQKVPAPGGSMVDETVAIGQEIYSGPQSPLFVEVKADGDGQFDFAISK